MAACPPGYACPAPVTVPLNQLEPPSTFQFLYTPFENQGDPATPDCVGEYMDFEFQCSSASGLLGAFTAEAPLEFWNAWRQEFVNAGSDMFTAKVYVQPPASYPGTATYRIIIVHSQSYDTFLDFVADLIGTIAKSPFLIVFLGIIFFGQSIVTTLQNLCNNVTGDYCHPIESAQGAYIWILGIGGVFTILTYVVINKFSKHEGLGPIAPPAPAGFAQPALHTESGVKLGPLNQQAGIGVSSSGSQPASYPRREPRPEPRVSKGKRAERAGEEEAGLGRRRR
jgi:hypothetical protein